MAVRRTKEPWMPADAYGRSLPRGVGINLLTDDIDALRDFCVVVLAAEAIHADEDFAALEIAGAPVMLHADHTYDSHPLTGIVAGAETRGAGVEIRLYGVDPDAAEARARADDHIVLAGSLDKPHGLRECFLIAPGGFVFVPSVAIKP